MERATVEALIMKAFLNPCGYFSIFIDQNPLNPECCEGFEIIGIWTGGTGSGNFYNSREIIPECAGTGTFTIGFCSAAPLKPQTVSAPKPSST